MGDMELLCVSMKMSGLDGGHGDTAVLLNLANLSSVLKDGFDGVLCLLYCHTVK